MKTKARRRKPSDEILKGQKKKGMIMHTGMGMPGGWEWLTIIFFGVFGVGIKLAFMVFIIVFLVKIRNTVETIRKKIEKLEEKALRGTQASCLR